MNIVFSDLITRYGSLPYERFYEWKTDLVTYDNAKEQRNQLWSEPRRHWTLHFDLLTNSDRAALLELFQRARGALETFLYKDTGTGSYSADYQVLDTECVLVGDGTAGPFQLVKTYYVGEVEAWTEGKHRIVPGTQVIKVGAVLKVNGVDYTIDNSTGLVTFLAGHFPANESSIAAAFDFYYLVRLGTDTYSDIMKVDSVWVYETLAIDEIKE